MAVREGMAGLILRTRKLVGDLATSPVFADQDVQDALDQYRFYHRYERTEPQATIQPGGHRAWTDFYTINENWEAPSSGSGDSLFNLADASYNLLAPDAADYLTGHFVFNAGVLNAVVWVTGQTYDIYAAGADLATNWAAQLARRFDFSDNNVRYQRSQQTKALLELADTLRERALPRAVDFTRSDIPANMPGSGFFNNPNERNQGAGRS